MLTVRRDGTTILPRVTLGRSEQQPGPVLGVAISTVGFDIDLPFPVQVDAGRIGGPSAGLLMALTVYDLADVGDLTRGRIIAGTGTIDAQGNVGPVGGVEQKIEAAVDARAQIFLAPVGEAEQARAAAGDRLQVIGVTTLDDAIGALKALRRVDPRTMAMLRTVRVYLGSDHAGFECKAFLAGHLTSLGHDVVDVGPKVFDPDDDYPPFCIETARRVVADPGSLGVVVGGSGNGEQISANKVPGCRAALAWSTQTATLAREHNDAQVMGIGARMHSPGEAAEIVEAFVNTSFSGGERHARRIAQISDFESTGESPPIPAG